MAFLETHRTHISVSKVTSERPQICDIIIINSQDAVGATPTPSKAIKLSQNVLQDGNTPIIAFPLTTHIQGSEGGMKEGRT